MDRDLFHGERKFNGYDGLKLYYQWWLPKEKRASIIIVHGIGEHSSRYEHVGVYFSGLGYSVYAYDQRGNGRSPGKRGHIKDFNEYLFDLKAFIEYLALKDNIFILGHSLGGLITISFAMDYPEGINGIVVTSPALGLSMNIPIWKKTLLYVMHVIYPEFTMVDYTISTEYLSHDPNVCRGYDEDPLVHRKRSARFFVEFVKACTKTVNEPQRLKIPSLFLQAGDDRIVSVEALEKFYKGVLSKNKSLKIYPSFYHEVLNEIGKEKVFKDIEEWLSSLVA